MNIGIFGGTFDPPHIGHLIVAESVKTEVSLDKIIFIPTSIAPHKQSATISLSSHRLEMVKLVTETNEDYGYSDCEVKQGGISYTVDTLQYLKQQYPSDNLFLLIGMDNYVSFEEWKEPQKILELCTLIVMNRPEYQQQEIDSARHANARFVQVPNIAISSSEIRLRVAEKKSIRWYVTPEVEEYIHTHTLYI